MIALTVLLSWRLATLAQRKNDCFHNGVKYGVFWRATTLGLWGACGKRRRDLIRMIHAGWAKRA
jgi:hypothetical protein